MQHIKTFFFIKRRMFLFEWEDRWNVWLHVEFQIVSRGGERGKHTERFQREANSLKRQWDGWTKASHAPFSGRTMEAVPRNEKAVWSVRVDRLYVYSHVKFSRTCLSNRDGKWITYTLVWHGSYGNACWTRRGGAWEIRSFLVNAG